MSRQIIYEVTLDDGSVPITAAETSYVEFAFPPDVGIFDLDVTAITGTIPTLDVLIQDQDPVSGNWRTFVTFAQKVSVSAERLVENEDGLTPFGNRLRAKIDTTGSGISITFTLGVQGKLSA